MGAVMWVRSRSPDISTSENNGWELCLHNRSLTMPEELRGPCQSLTLPEELRGSWCLFAWFLLSWRELEAGEVMICGSHGHVLC